MTKEVIEYGDKKLNIRFAVTTNKPRKLETKVIKYEGEGNELKISSMAHMSLPFFTKRKKGRDFNLVYEIGFLGLTMKCSLNSDAELSIQQPGEFEESVYDFLLQNLYKRYKNTKGIKASQFLAEEYMTFEVKELVEYLGVKYSPSYGTKIKNALENLKKTTYSFNRKNKKKSDKKILEFEHEDIVLINYELLKVGNKHYYKVKVNNPIAVESFEKNLIMHFTDESIKSIVDKSKLAERIYKYISMNRFDSDHGESTINEIACIIPYELSGTYVKSGKTYKRNRLKEAIKMISKNFDVLKKVGYIKNYEINGNENITYTFSNEKLGLVTGSTLKRHYNAIKISDTKETNKILKLKEVKVKFSDSDNLSKAINKAKNNRFALSVWDKRVDNKIAKIVKENGEAYAIKILGAIYNGLKGEITTTLVQYINGIMKNIPNVSEKKLFDIPAELLNKTKKTDTQNYKNIKEGKIQIIEKAVIIEKASSVNNQIIDERESVVYKILYDGVIKKLNEMFKENPKLLKTMVDSVDRMKTINAITGYLSNL